MGADIRSAPPGEHPGPVVREFRIDLRHEAIAPLQHDEPDLVTIHMLVKSCDAVGKSSQLTEQLDPDQPAADDHEGELPAFTFRIDFHVGTLEALDDVV